MTECELIKLKNGMQEAKPLVAIIGLHVKRLIEKNPIALYELVMKCRNRDHQFFGNAPDILKDLNLLESDNSVHSSIRNIILSLATGDGLDMKFVNPVM